MRNLILLLAVLSACGGTPDPDPDAATGGDPDADLDAAVDATALIDGPLGTPGMCDPVTQQGCGPGQGCYPSDGSPNYDPRGHCAVAGSLGLGGSCQSNGDCAVGLTCETSNSGRCFQICVTSATCPTSASTCDLYAHGQFGMCI
jgi:hypothetical protein